MTVDYGEYFKFTVDLYFDLWDEDSCTRYSGVSPPRLNLWFSYGE